jgi:hypothetical protein
MRYHEIITEHSLGKLYKHENMEAVGYWYNPTTGRYATIAWEASDGVNAHSDHADYPWENPELFGITTDQLKDWAEGDGGDGVRHGLIMKGWARIGYNTKWGMRVDAKNATIARRSIQWFAKHHGMPTAVSVTVGAKHHNLKADQVEEFARTGRFDPAALLTRP